VATPGADCKDLEREAMRPKPLRVKLFCGMIGRIDRLVEAQDHLAAEFGRVDLESRTEPFRFTDYYEQEMGSGLYRRWIAFAALKERAYLAQAKHIAVSVEDRLSIGGRRTVNIDPGYVDNAQVVLSTAKNFAHRLYIGLGYYAEVTMLYVEGSFRFLDWTYPDYKGSSALEFFKKARASYYREMRERGDS
jgi:hypothetical protein